MGAKSIFVRFMFSEFELISVKGFGKRLRAEGLGFRVGICGGVTV